MNNLEIEKKFLLNNDSWKSLVVSKLYVTQGYLLLNKDLTLRIRHTINLSTHEDKCYVTWKEKITDISRHEYEKEISKSEYDKLSQAVSTRFITKTRYIVPYVCYEKTFKFEIDEFVGDNNGLIIAELELESEDEFDNIQYPSFIGKDVTSFKELTNVQLTINPYCDWNNDLKQKIGVRMLSPDELISKYTSNKSHVMNLLDALFQKYPPTLNGMEYILETSRYTTAFTNISNKYNVPINEDVLQEYFNSRISNHSKYYYEVTSSFPMSRILFHIKPKLITDKAQN